MSIKDNLKRLMRKKLVRGQPITPNALATATAIPQSTLWRLLSGEVSDIKGKNLDKLAEFFEVTAESLRSGVAKSISVPPPPVHAHGSQPQHLDYVTLEELEMLTAYRSSNSVGRHAIFAAVIGIGSGSPAEPVKKPNVRNIR